MAKEKTIYVCQNCGANSLKWLGKCPACDQWNTLQEERTTAIKSSSQNKVSLSQSEPTLLSEVNAETHQRMITGIEEFDRVLGGGIVPGSVILLGGEPGIGKSTLALQLAAQLSNKNLLYISGEESPHQVKYRYERLSLSHNSFLIWPETLLESIADKLKNINPDLLIIDSIQTLYSQNLESAPGTVSQIRECTSILQSFAKQINFPLILIGHITKEGQIAGPKVLEHMVDVVLQFEGEQHKNYRILRSLKNRFGATSELGLFEMNNKGLKEINNPSNILLKHRDDNVSGCTVACSVDGLRPFLVEIEALVSTAAYGTPQRSTTGFDHKRLNMLLAVLEKRAGFKLAFKDVFINVAGGIKINDPAMDLAVVASVLSSNFDVSINTHYCFAGEVGLTGEIRPVLKIEQRIKEAAKLGFKKFFIPYNNHKEAESLSVSKIEIVTLRKIEDLLKALFK